MKTITSLFARHAARETTALVSGSESLTYRELEARSEEIADALWDLGVRPEHAVVISAERTVDTIAALLGILKCGACYVPVDARWPAARLQHIAARTSAALALFADDGPRCGIATLCIAELDGAPPRPRGVAIDPDNLAYVMFTSGSTGTPKAIGVPHRAVARLVDGPDFVRVAADDVFLYNAPLGFDASTFEIWMPLANGCRLELAPPGPLSPRELARVVRERGVTVLWLTAGLFARVIEDACDLLGGLRALLAGGDVLPPRAVRTALAKLPATRLVNGYGPTENTTFTCCHTIEAGDASSAIPIGTAISGTYVRIVDGELLAGGEGLARGYHRDPRRTAESFVPDPDSAIPGARVYRTGDRARVREDGAIEFHGRIDDQVKLSGYRIEPAEIAHVLGTHPAVRLAAVAARGGRLVAWVQTQRSVRESELTAFLAERLPHYMIPAQLVFVDELRLNEQGKVDRGALPEPPRSLETPEPQKTSTSATLQAIWRDVLGLATIPDGTDFFRCGGDSLTATQVVGRVRARFGAEIPLSRFFETPTLDALAAMIDAAPAESRLPAASTFPAGDAPPTYSQERVWFLQQLEPESLAYQFQATIRFRGPLDAHALRASLRRVVERHEIYRTTFPAGDDGQPRQAVHPPPDEVWLDELELGDGELAGAIAMEVARRFDVARLPLVRWVLFRVAPDDHVLLHVEHHLIHDGWSFNIFLAELFAFYEDVRAELPAPLQSGQFARWQRRLVASGAIDAQLDAWAGRLRGAGTPLALPYDRPRPAAQTFRGATLRIALTPSECARIRETALEHHGSPFIVMAAAFAALLHRYSGDTDVTLGTGVANRRETDAEWLMTMAINTVALRCDLGGDPSVRDLLAHVRARTLEAYDRQDAPFDLVVGRVRPQRDPSVNPLFQVMFSFHDAPAPISRLPKLAVTVTEGLSNGSAKFDMNLIVVRQSYGERRQDDEAWTIIWEYNSDLFDRETVERMAAQYRATLGELTDPAHAAARISDLALLSEEERISIASWNDTATHVEPDVEPLDVPSRIAAQPRDAVALVYRGETVTYAELDARAEAIARGLDAGPHDVVAVQCSRSPHAVAAMLAAWKRGAAYLPIDPSLPAARAELMKRDAGVRVTIAGGTPPADGAARAHAAGDLAYVIYTSGSTGVPKGVEVTHRNLANLAADFARRLETGPASRVLAATSFSFDISGLELWVTLASGGCVVLADDVEATDPAALARLIGSARPDVIQATPALWSALLATGVELSEATLLAGGEAVPVELARALLRRGKRVLDVYGPTETTIWSTALDVGPQHAAGRTVPIGAPIANTRVHVVDRRLRPVAVGAVGELVIGGDGVARGYRNRRALTASRFVPDPFGAAGARLYRTGDRARWRRDGVLEFLGRVDHQVKVRGFRVELGEVEAALAAHPNVAAAAAVAHDRGDGASLVAFVVPRGSLTPGALRTHAAERLPAYMVPTRIVLRDALPLTNAGKVDRRALAESLGDLERESPAASEPPRTDTEKIIAAVWTEVLGRPSPNLDTSFFEIGGHSLLGVRIVSLLQRRLGVQLPLRTLFDTGTIRTMAAAVEHLRPSAAAASEFQEGEL